MPWFGISAEASANIDTSAAALHFGHKLVQHSNQLDQDCTIT